MCIYQQLHYSEDDIHESPVHYLGFVHKTTDSQTWTTIENLQVFFPQIYVLSSLVPPTQWVLEWS